MLCPSCHGPVPEGSRFCPCCGAAVDDPPGRSSPGDEAATRLPSRSSASVAVSSASSSGGWLTASASIDHGQLAPGAVLDQRYRVVGLIGRGGMGEVYRADDLRLGQPVALKLLPPRLATDVARLAQFHTEVRTARQVSHPNVCRVYDIGEVDGRLYLTMEYVDGEDLSSLLRRIGRLPEDKSLDIARQICAGLAAAHEKGVIHRDLKPANVMIDGTGKARVMDFSLATAGEVTSDVRAGTPAYMAPEQLEGRAVTPRSDIYALGLVLYELMTGRRAFDARTVAELVAQHQSGTITPPSEIVKTIDPAIERAILRCLESDPDRRPASALSVAASLPGGDPLAAALAAGETPSPEMVAAAGGDEATVRPFPGLAWIALTVVLVIAAGAVGDRVLLLARTPLVKPAEVLLDRAEEVRRALGYTEGPRDQAWGFAYDRAYLDWAAGRGAGAAGWKALAEGRPAPVRFWYRASPRPILPLNPLAAPGTDDPPLSDTGMATVQVDMAGRLVAFEARPPQVDAAARAPAPEQADWARLFAVAAIDPAGFSETAPSWTPPSFADARRAWLGRLPGTDVSVRVEAASYRGRPVFFQIIGPWTPALRDTGVPGRSASGDASLMGIVLVLVLLVVAAVLARANLKSGRADRRGAFRLAAFAVVLRMAAWLLSPHVRSVGNEQLRLFVGLGLALFVGGTMYVVYLALEPHVRRVWPTMLVGWSRVLSGRVRDALVGHDLLIGSAAGVALGLATRAFPLVLRASGQSEGVPGLAQPDVLLGGAAYLRTVLLSLDNGLQQGLIQVLMFALLRELVGRVLTGRGASRAVTDHVVTAVAVALFTALSVVSSQDGTRLSSAVLAAVTTAVTIRVILRIGMLAAVAMFFVESLVERMPLTLDPSRLYTPSAWTTMAGVVALSILALWTARAGEPFFGQARQGSQR